MKSRMRTPEPPPSPLLMPGTAMALAPLGAVAGLALLAASLAGGFNGGVFGMAALVTVAYGSVAGRLWQQGRLGAIGVDRWAAAALGTAAMVEGIRRSGASPVIAVQASTMAFHVGGFLGLAWALAGPRLDLPWDRQRPESGADAHLAGAWGWRLAALSAALGALTVFARWYANTALKTSAPSDAIFMFFMPRSAGYEGIPGGPPPGLLPTAAATAWMAATLAASAWLALRRRAGDGVLLAAVALLAWFGKLNLAVMAPSGLVEHLAHKVAHVGTRYLELVPRVRELGVWRFITEFNQLQAGLGTHAETHPFGPELLYLALSRVLGPSPFAVALGMTALTLLTGVAVFLTAQRLHGGRWAGLAAGLLYLFTPQQLLLSGAGTDCLITAALAWLLYLLLAASEERSALKAALAGALLFLASLISVGIFLPLVFVGFWLALRLRADARGAGDWARQLALLALAFLGTFVLLHAGLRAATGGRFHYEAVLQGGVGVQVSLLTARPYAIWVWLNAFLLGAFIGWPLVAALLLRLWDAAQAVRAPEPVLAGTFLFGALVVFVSLGNAEAQRMFQYCAVPAVLAALPLVLRPSAVPGEPASVDLRVLAVACGLLFVNTVALQSTVLDYW